MGKGNWIPCGKENVPYSLVYIELEWNEEMVHDDYELQYNDLKDLIAHELPEQYWGVGKSRPMNEIDPSLFSWERVMVFAESDEAYVLMTGNEWSEALCFYPKTNDDGQYFNSLTVEAEGVFTRLKVQHGLAVRRRTSPYTSLAYEPLKLMEVRNDKSNDRGRQPRL